ncbi:nucleotide sugar dehydrogenase [Nostoc sp. 'Lobaria pulmonaria (5183) cyanobiont']|uniref:nucleotide sugar dehydrogenase n=1 Tax=Nostoc sp. 'Lobaria pulmonaria (5183) cyanobiont' TaxID=1618022 RepID=UPI000CF30B23|nr:UDP-glucose/GDP-mannose dehydrogenase family protein [Nostoc sp. 'Lobaria pulmonaria (5183) cyanobiont']AVH72854.1 UDP-glucose/GDP-mannose dehydrogenase [Nostoc sp. 'Lobaria pulmonaria (5183) cyanobiont']
MKISIFGLGYVGAVTAACLARDGHEVIGVDVNPEKVDLIAKGESPIVEPQLSQLLVDGVAANLIRATTDAEAAVLASDVSLISVGTPPRERGEPDLTYVWNVCKQIGKAAIHKTESHVVVLRSTVPPGTLEKCQNLLDSLIGDNSIHLAFNPEFLREGSAIKDYDQPPYTIIGTESPVAEAAVRQMYATVDAPFTVVQPSVAEMVKYVANCWHAAKVGFANEIGRVAKAFGVDGREVMNIIVQDTKLNISPVYMRPGFAYGGSCLPKDLSALLYHAKNMDVPVPLLNALPTTNSLQVDLAAQQVLRLGVRQIAVLGLAFKPGTDDLRESPAVLLVKRLIGEGCQVKIYDPAVYEARLMGTNLDYIQSNLPHFEALLVPNSQQALEGADLAVVTHATPEFRQVLLEAPKGIQILDLAGVLNQTTKELGYHGIAW